MRIRITVNLIVIGLLYWSVQTASAETDPLAAVEKARLSGDYKLEMQLLEPLVHGSQANNPEAHFKYAICLRDLRRYEEARKHLERAIELAPKDHWVSAAAKDQLNYIKPPSPITPSRTKGGRIGYIGILIQDGIVLRVVPGSPAEKANIAVRDKIISFDGKSAMGLTDEELTKGMRGLEGASLKLVIERNGKQYSCSITRGRAVHYDGHGPPLEIESVATYGPNGYGPSPSKYKGGSSGDFGPWPHDLLRPMDRHRRAK